MKFSVNSYIWASPFSTEMDLALIDKAKTMGFDCLEISVEDPKLVNVGQVKARLNETGLQAILCGAFGPGRNVSSIEEGDRQEAQRYLRWMVDTAAAIDCHLIVGPMYSAIQKEAFQDPADRSREWDYAVTGLKAASGYAASKGISLAIEPINRFECDVVNTADQGLQMIAEVGAANFGLHLDTFHMHIEEKDPAAAIRKAGEKLFHVHASENDRGIPGSGQVGWQRIAAALRDISYSGYLGVESFTPHIKPIAKAASIWRRYAPSQDDIARDGLVFLKSLFSD